MAKERKGPVCFATRDSGVRVPTLWRRRRAQERQRLARDWRVSTKLLVGAGAAAATCSGCLSALAGIGGPPIILMYELLRVPQVRARPSRRAHHSVR